MMKPSGLRDFFEESLYVTPEGTPHQISDLIRALPAFIEEDKVASAIRKEKRNPTQDEFNIMAKADGLRDKLIQVNVFDHISSEEEQEGYVRPAIQGTAERLS